jgi:hypothetical protein
LPRHFLTQLADPLAQRLVLPDQLLHLLLVAFLQLFALVVEARLPDIQICRGLGRKNAIKKL